MQIQTFPSCCGIHIISKLGHDAISGHGAELTSEKEIKKYIENYRNIEYASKIQMIILNNCQLNSIGKQFFLDLNFTITPLGLYKGHGSDLFMLHYNSNENGDKLK